jgi:hypothetical protein
VVAVIAAIVVILTVAILTLAHVAFFDRNIESVTEKRRQELEEDVPDRGKRMFGSQGRML